MFCPHCGAYMRTRFVGWTLYLTLLAMVCSVVLIWLAEFLYAQHRPPNPDEWPCLPKPMHAVTAYLSEALPSAADFRLEPRGNFNLQIYLPRSRFASLHSHDRDEILERIMQAWCGNIPKAAFVPFVQIRELDTGDEWATGRCPLAR